LLPLLVLIPPRPAVGFHLLGARPRLLVQPGRQHPLELGPSIGVTGESRQAVDRQRDLLVVRAFLRPRRPLG
jgi:hypothetical protein